MLFQKQGGNFIALLEDDFMLLFKGLTEIIVELPKDTDKAAKIFSRRYTRVILSLEDLLSLASLANGVLEQNIPIEVMRPFKTMPANGLVYAGKQIEVRLPGLKRGQGALLLLQTYGLTLGLWQAF